MRTKPVSPSKLSTFVLCPLRYVLETERPKEGAIPPGPMALRGTAVHHVIQAHAGRPLPSGREIRDAYMNAVVAEATRPDGNALIRLAVENGGASELFAQEQIVAASQFIRKILQQHQDNLALHDPARRETGALSVPDRRPALFGIERKLSSSELDMEGRVDLLYKDDGGTVHVTDFKTGNVLEVGGEPKSSYLIQMAAYGVLVQETLSPAKILLELSGPSSEWSGPFGPELDCNVKTLVSRLHARLPKDEPIAATTIATTGAHCQGCTYRPSCPAYISLLESGAPDGGVLSQFDFSTAITDATHHSGWATLRAVTNKQTVISLSGVPTSIYPELAAGTKIRAFSLGAFDVLARAAFPANFYVYRRDMPKSSAFASLIKTIPP
jgi:hypothetical protein